jgi:hypothetical protein
VLPLHAGVLGLARTPRWRRTRYRRGTRASVPVRSLPLQLCDMECVSDE